MLVINIWENYKDEPNAIGIEWNNDKKEIGYTIQNIPFKNFVTPFVANIMFKNFGLLYIFENNKKLNFDVQELCTSWMGDGTWYNTTTFSHLHGYLFENFFKTGRKYRYDHKCAIDTYGKQKPPTGPDDVRNGGGRTFTIHW